MQTLQVPILLVTSLKDQRAKFDKAMDDSATRIGEAKAKADEKEPRRSKTRCDKAMVDAFQPGSKIQSRLARIGGDRTITTDPVQAQMLNIQKQNLKANERIAMALEDYDGPTFPSR